MVSHGYQKRTRPSWDEYFIQQVETLGTRATCDRGRSAAIFVRNNDQLAAGYVGSPPGEPHCDDVGHLMSADGLHCIRTLHAEQNALIRAARIGVSLIDSTLYCTMEPCFNCAMTVVGLGVRRVVAYAPYHAADRTRDLFRRTNIEFTCLQSVTLYNH